MDENRILILLCFQKKTPSAEAKMTHAKIIEIKFLHRVPLGDYCEISAPVSLRFWFSSTITAHPVASATR